MKKESGRATNSPDSEERGGLDQEVCGGGVLKKEFY